MSGKDEQRASRAARSHGRRPVPADPSALARGLKRIYDDVLEEPLPAFLTDLLSQLDAPEQ